MILKLTKYKVDYNSVYISRPDYSPYIYYLFYNQISPKLFQNQVIRYADTSEGFSHVKFELVGFELKS